MKRAIYSLFAVAVISQPSIAQIDWPATGPAPDPLSLPRWSVAPTGAEQAARERYMKRLDERGAIPANAIMQAKEQADLLPGWAWSEASIMDASLGSWEYLGPGNIGGRVRSIVFIDNNTVLAGAASGGILRSTNAGLSWSTTSDFLPSLAVVSLSRDASNSNKVYAGTGESFAGHGGDNHFVPGAGVFVSFNGGQNWQQLLSTVNWQAVSRVTAHPFVANTVFAAVANSGTDYNGIWKSIDSGISWTRVLNTGNGFQDIKIDDTAWANMMAAGGNELWISKNHGDSGTWSEQTVGGTGKLRSDGGRCEAVFGHHETWWVSMNFGGGEVWYSADGTTWERRSAFNYLETQGGYDNVIWVAPYNNNLVVVGGIDLYRSIDGGRNFLKISDWRFYHNGQPIRSAHADQHAIVHHPSFDQGFPPNKTVYFGNDGGVQRTDNIDLVIPSTGWVNLANDLGATQFYTGAVSGDGTLIGGAQDNSFSIRRAGNGANNWYQPTTGDGAYVAIHPTNSNKMYASTQFLNVTKSTDNGYIWTDANTGLGDGDNNGNGSSLFIAPMIMDPNSSTRLYAGGARLWRTSDEAENWTQLRAAIAPDATCTVGGSSNYTPLISAISVAKGNLNILWVGYFDGQVHRSLNFGASWTRVDDNGTTPIPACRFVTDIAINPNNHNDVIVALGGYNFTQLWRTLDGGATWTQLSGNYFRGLPAIHISSVTFHPRQPEWIYVGTDLGIYASENGGTEWNRYPSMFNTSDGPINGEISKLFWLGDETIYASTYGRGMWRCWAPETYYINWSYNGNERGSQSEPFNTVQEAVDRAARGMTYSINAGNYNEGHKVARKKSKWVATGGAVRIR